MSGGAPSSVSVHDDEAVRQELIEITCELIRGRGENPGETEAESVRAIAEQCRAIGAEVTLQEVAPGRENLSAVLGDPNGPRFLFLGHSDVVPAGTGWSTDPFDPTVTDDRIIGRGTTDMKGGIAATIVAMREIVRLRPDVCVELLCTVDEEDLALGVHRYIEETPSRSYEACIVAEPTDLDVVIGCRGATNFSLHFTGASAHAGRPWDGASAILAAARGLEVIRTLMREAEGHSAPLIGGPTWNVGRILGGTGTSVVAQNCLMTIDRRTLPFEKAESILSDLLQRVRFDVRTSHLANADLITVEGSVDMVMPGFFTTPESPLPVAAAAVMENLGRSGELTGWTAACEGGYISAHHNVPTIILGPGELTTQAHQPDESVKIEDLSLAAQAYIDIVLNLVSTRMEEV
ncbi:MAG: M20 family metallopeptidase [Leucobacter sp.]